MTAEPIISIRNLSTRFGAHVVHEDLNLDVRRGEILAVVGGSGAGKSVLLRSVIGLQEYAAGEITVFGENLRKAPYLRAQALRRRWGVLFQDGALFSSLTVGQNVKAPLREHLHLPEPLMEDIAAMKLSMVGLPLEAATKYPHELSGGMRKRAGLARALALDPELVFLDEPTAGLDPIGAARFDELIVDLKSDLGLTVFMVTHDLDTLHATCDRVAVLAEKRVIVVGSLKEVREFDHPWVRNYFSGPRGRAAAVANCAPGAAIERV